MREILYKAKAINRDPNHEYRTNYKNGDWVFGLVTRLVDEEYKCDRHGNKMPTEMRDVDGNSGIDIDQDTICEYIGLTDKNGAPVFENDYVRNPEDGFIYTVIWNANETDHEDGFGFVLFHTSGLSRINSATMSKYEVVGNVFENTDKDDECDEDEQD